MVTSAQVEFELTGFNKWLNVRFKKNFCDYLNRKKEKKN